MEALAYLIPSLIFIALLIVVFRLFGAWMLRINELIKLLWIIKEMLETKMSAEELEAAKAKLKKRGY